MPSKGTTIRSVRVPDDLWEAAQVKARAEGTTVSGVVQAALREFVGPPMAEAELWAEQAQERLRSQLIGEGAIEDSLITQPPPAGAGS